jgi:hypothetical protein
MSDPTSFSLLKRSNGLRYVLYEADGRMRWKSTRTRSKSLRCPSILNSDRSEQHLGKPKDWA